MKTKLLSVLAVCGLVLLVAGCVGTVDGRSRAGNPFTRDKFHGRYERPVSQVFTAAKEVLMFNGVLNGENTVNNSLEAKVDTRTVWVRVEQVDLGIALVTVQARTKGGGADKDLAHEIEKQIALRLR